VYTALCRVTRHGSQFFVDQRLAPYEQQVTDVVLDTNINYITRFLKRNASPFLRVEPVHREPTKIALRVADIRDRKLQVTRSTVVEHLPNQFEQARFGPADWRERSEVGTFHPRWLFGPCPI
jgi:hypothetical protein